MEIALDLEFPAENEDDNWTKFFQQISAVSSSDMVHNVRTKMRVEKTTLGAPLPITINSSEFDNSYVCSPYTAYFSYAEQELCKIDSAVVRVSSKIAINLLKKPMRKLGINKVIYVNNWLLSTNLYPKVSHANVRSLTSQYISKYKNHFLGWRSLNEHSNHNLIETLREYGYDLIPSRQVYIFPREKNFKDRKNSMRDLRLLRETPFRVVKIESASCQDLTRFKRLYDQLYLEKYSYHNPQFTENFIRSSLDSKTIKLFGLKNQNGEWQGVVGCLVRNGVMTTPVVGYNTDLPQKLGIYRTLMVITLCEAQRLGVDLNLSSGASKFKILRGGFPFVEYTAIYRRHLSKSRQLMIVTLKKVLDTIVVPIMKKHEL